jgi:hypothetical protein
MRRIQIPLDHDETRALVILAESKDRDPRRQAARLVREGLIRAGVLPITVTDYCHVTANTAGVKTSTAVPA